MDCSDKGKKSYRERYKSIGESDWFKEHYEGKSLGEIIEEGKSKKGNSNSQLKRFFDKPGINDAQYAYKLAGVKPKHGKDTKEMKNARSLFAKKKNEFVDKFGNKYKFNSKEVNKLTSLISNNKLSENVDKPKDKNLK